MSSAKFVPFFFSVQEMTLNVIPNVPNIWLVVLWQIDSYIKACIRMDIERMKAKHHWTYRAYQKYVTLHLQFTNYVRQKNFQRDTMLPKYLNKLDMYPKYTNVPTLCSLPICPHSLPICPHSLPIWQQHLDT